MTSVRLGDLIKVHHGWAFPGSGFGTDPELPQLVTPGNFEPGGGFVRKVKSFSGEFPSSFVLNPGDLIVSMTDLSKEGATLGKPAVVPNDGTFLHNQRIGKVEILDDSYLDKNYLKALLLTEEFHKQVLSTATGSTVRHTSPSRIYEFEFALPNLNHQRAIGEVLGALDDKIAANRDVRSRTEVLAVAVASKCSRQVGLSEVARPSRTSVSPEKLGTETVMHFSLPAYDEGAARLESAHQIKSAKNEISNPAVLISKLNPRIPRLWPVDTEAAGVRRLASAEFVALEPSELGVGELWAAILQGDVFGQMQSLVGGTSNSHQRVRPQDILDAVVPDARELDAGDRELLGSLCRLRNHLTEENISLSRTRDELLPLLMDGRITVKDAERIAADVL